MSEVVFARTRYVYDSYTDFWTLVELSGFPTVYVDEMDLYNPEHVYITAPLNGEWTPHLDNHPGRKASFWLWNLERPGDAPLSKYKADNQALIDAGYLTGVIVSDRELAKRTGFHFVPVGSHGRMGKPGFDKKFDVIGLMCYSLRRAFLFDYLTPLKRYQGISIAPNGWGRDRHLALTLSKYMINVHQDGHPFIEPLRFSLAAAYGLPIISEASVDTYPYTKERDVFEAEQPEALYRVVQKCNSMYSRIRSLGIMMRTKMIGEYSFRRCIERFL